ncbi:MAG TPA: hypothetical protein OIM43_13235 [Prevotellaceae bacterium]|nr:hypothetical protein [Prevotellaceae bacterium]
MKNIFSVLCIFFPLVCVSCGNNMISIDAENSSIYSTDNYILRYLTLDTDSAEFTYRILLKSGYAGSPLINLNSIDDAYLITYNDSIVVNKDFHLRANSKYLISNFSFPDAGHCAIEFSTNSNADIISSNNAK